MINIVHGNFQEFLMEIIGPFDSFEEADSYGTEFLTEDWIIINETIPPDWTLR